MMSLNNAIISANIVKCRKKAKLTKTDVVKALNITYPTYRKLETQPTTVPIVKLEKLADLFGCDIRSFFML